MCSVVACNFKATFDHLVLVLGSSRYVFLVKYEETSDYQELPVFLGYWLMLCEFHIYSNVYDNNFLSLLRVR